MSVVSFCNGKPIVDKVLGFFLYFLRQLCHWRRTFNNRLGQWFVWIPDRVSVLLLWHGATLFLWTPTGFIGQVLYLIRQQSCRWCGFCNGMPIFDKIWAWYVYLFATRFCHWCTTFNNRLRQWFMFGFPTRFRY